MKRAKNIIDIETNLTNGRIIALSDIHFPFQDEKAVSAALNYVRFAAPEIIVLNGDIMDFYMLSRFAKGEGRNPMEEIEMCRSFMRLLRDENPQAQIYYTLGNHETRLEKNILMKAPELASIIEDVFTILKVSEFDIRGCSSLTVNDNLVFKHGTLLGNKSCLSAIKEMENSYMSGCSGHTHRLGKYIARKAGRKFVWIESGCLCDLNPEYVANPNWQQGFAEFTIADGKVYHSKIIEIENGIVLD